jgi:hypothetical protein
VACRWLETRARCTRIASTAAAESRARSAATISRWSAWYSWRFAAPGLLDDAVQRGQQRAAAGPHDAPVQGQVPALELLVAGRVVAAGQAAVHLVQVRGRGPGHDQRHGGRLEQPPDHHHVGGREVPAPGRRPAGRFQAGALPALPARPARPGPPARGRLAQERAPADLAGDVPLRLQQRQRVPHRGPGHAQVEGQPALGGQPGARAQPGPPRLGQDQPGQPRPVLAPGGGGTRRTRRFCSHRPSAALAGHPRPRATNPTNSVRSLGNTSTKVALHPS